MAANTASGRAAISTSPITASSVELMLTIYFLLAGVHRQNPVFTYCSASQLAFPGFLLFDKFLQAGQISLPEFPVLLNPAINFTQRPGIEVIHALAADLFFAYQLCSPQHAQVLG